MAVEGLGRRLMPFGPEISSDTEVCLSGEPWKQRGESIRTCLTRFIVSMMTTSFSPFVS